MINSNPYYYVEEISVQGASTPYLAVYEISKESLSQYAISKDLSVIYKKVVHRQVDKTRVVGLTKLSKLVTKGKDKVTEKHTQTLVAKPLFLAEEEPGIDSFTNEYGMGFMEYVKNPDEILKANISNHKGMPPATIPTGVFISVKHIAWQKQYIPIAGLVGYLSDLIDNTFGMPSIDVFGG